MTIRDLLNKAFGKPTAPPQRRHDDKINVEARERLEAERETATAIDQKQTELLRTKLTPELTPYGTQPRRPPTEEQARVQAEKLVTGKTREDAPAVVVSDQAAGQDRPAPTQAFTAKADPDRPAAPLDKAAKEDARAPTDPASELLEAEKVDDRTRTAPLEPQIITESYIADIDTLQARHEAEAAPELTTEEREARAEASRADRAARDAAYGNEHDLGRTMGE